MSPLAATRSRNCGRFWVAWPQICWPPISHITHVNEIRGGSEVAAHLLEFDSLHGRWRQNIGSDCEGAIRIGNRCIGFTNASMPEDVPWGDLGYEIVLECTGKFLKPDQLQGYF